MLGAIAGDVIGSTYEFYAPKTTDFELIPANSFPTDDSLLTLAVAKWLMDDADLVTEFKRMVLQAPHAGWGGMFSQWAVSESAEPYNSFGNGSAMRVSPVGYACDTLEETLERAEQSAAVTHDHPEGIKGAQATAAVVFLARTTRDRDAIRSFVEERIGYDVSRSLAEIRPRLHLQRDLPADGARGDRGLPRVARLRERGPQRRLARRRRGHARLHHGRHRRGVLWPCARSDPGCRLQQAGTLDDRSGGALPSAVPGLSVHSG
jgi:hypothetical protein